MTISIAEHPVEQTQAVPMQNAARQNLSDQVAVGIREYIADHGLKPGDRLPTEHELADYFGVSRISVREATKALGFLGIVDSAPRRGLRVSELDMDRTSDFIGFHLAISDYPIEQLVETRIVIESGGLPWLMERMSEDATIHAELDAINRRLEAARTIRKWIELDIDFHRHLLQASGLKPLLAFHDLLDVFFQRVRRTVKKADWPDGIRSHQRMIDALRDGRLEPACRELRAHVESHLRRVKG